ncbi:efflux RND transporter periplasmic adaptor subunit [Rubrivirga sp. S365]|uniref:Efflux RND transporter periplasmic adaptor subunit n=1 Tax=Rubrivirga litoralis TaxID=3075598 RepID=A0ABU3BLG6_9BACT|nr:MULTISPECIES: efflux RND transporter periplasmic adaptor subunit [unclassified Rubrivirga]MDT0630137.1 efflux RND transporter periplasmic adaptor subunit [Rubrivirga sp. F394]MDT7855648.1 efflux RND transporter periplasmic adaptor subunit [Rubrivirga sp. S365]
MSPTKKILIGLGVAVVLLVVVAALLGGGDEGLAVETSEARVRSITETVTAAGTVASEVEVVVSSDVSGEIVLLAVQEGDRVEAGQLLLRIRPDIYASQVEQAQTQVTAAQSGVGEARGSVAEAEQAVTQARADVAQATADRERAERAYKRQQDLFERDVVSAADLEAARGTFEVAQAAERSARERVGGAEARVATSRGRVRSAQAQAQGAQAQAREAGQQLAKTAIYAPITGTVTQLNVELGERIVGTAQMTGTELMRIARLDAMTMEIDVNENDVVRVATGDSARVEVDAYPDDPLGGSVVEIANSARIENVGTTQATTNFPVVVRLAAVGADAGGAGINERPRAPGPALRPGMSGTVDIYTRTVPNAVVVPIQAVTVRDFNEVERERRRQAEAAGEAIPDAPVPDGEDLRRVVFVVEDGTAVLREVETGISDDTHIEVRSGLTGGETVISGPFRLLRTEISDADAVRESDGAVVEEDE